MTYSPYRGKRAFDLLMLVLVALPAIAVGVICAVAIKLDDGGPVFFRQERVGWRGAPFRVVKFRTMLADQDNPMFPDAAHITRVGRILRRLSLDELPQCINVLRGEMSVVGPRPTLAYQVARYDERQRVRLAVRPGLTGLAQVKGRNNLPWAQRIELDLVYLQRQSPIYDAYILLLSVAVVLRQEVEGHPTDDPLARPE